MKNYQIENFIGVFDGFFPEEYCKFIIEYFDYNNKFLYSANNVHKSDNSIILGGESGLAQSTKTLDLTPDNAENIINTFNKIFWDECYKIYAQEIPYLDIIGKHGTRQYKIKKTEPKQGYHVFHCEQGSWEVGNRLGFAILYLNDIADGGETEFLYQSQRVAPKTGRLIYAPASFTHVHRGNPPLKENKYILTTWVEFIS